MSTLSTTLFIIGVQLAPGAIGPIREVIAVFMALILPHRMVHPINTATKVVFPPIISFQRKMEEYPRLRTILPGFLASEVILMVSGIILIAVSRVV